MIVTTATGAVHEAGQLINAVNDFCSMQAKVMAEGVTSALDWEPVAAFIEPSQFKRVGAYLEVLNWREYREFLTGWVSGGTKFEMTVFRMTEIGDTVFQEIEERHYRGDEFIRKNVIAVFRFNDRKKIVHLDIYEQATDSGQWIAESARIASRSSS